MGEAALQILTPTAIVLALIGVAGFLSRNWVRERLKGAIGHEYDVRLADHEDALSRATDLELAKIQQRLDVELELIKLKLGPYSAEQFRLYNELWAALCDLRRAMDELWVNATWDSLGAFASALDSASDKLERSALLVEPHHYEELRAIMVEFMDYRLGKHALIEFHRGNVDLSRGHPFDPQQLLEANGERRQRLLEYLTQMKECLRRQLSEPGRSCIEPADGADAP
jgi:hypothetical protein